MVNPRDVAVNAEEEVIVLWQCLKVMDFGKIVCVYACACKYFTGLYVCQGVYLCLGYKY